MRNPSARAIWFVLACILSLSAVVPAVRGERPLLAVANEVGNF
jgi:hypothetical protein